MTARLLAVFLSFLAMTQATTPPSYSGYSLIWSDNFDGPGGTLPDQNTWNIISGYLDVNDELETYEKNTKEVQLSGGDTLQLVPWPDSSTEYGWASGRVESIYVFTPAAGEITRVEAQIRFGSNPMSEKQGFWPAFWMLGNILREGGSWPACGELDIMERIDGQLVGHGTMHCDTDPGGVCDEPDGLGASVQIPNQSWHTWRLEWNREPSSWEDETITWYLDGTSFHVITGSQIGDESVWDTVAHSSMYFILNVAVGGDWVSILYRTLCASFKHSVWPSDC